MKEWLKHKYGYLNIDGENIYFTKTGNWSETADLTEKNSKEFKTADQKSKTKIISFIGIIGSVFLWLFLSKIGTGDFTILQIIGPLITSYLVYKYLTPEYGAAFVVPYNKIQKIEFENDIATVHFIDHEGKNATHRLMKLDLNGIELVNRIEYKGANSIQ